MGRSEAFIFRPDPLLFLLQHVHQFNPHQSPAGCVEGLEPQHRPGDPLYGPMVLFHNVIQILTWRIAIVVPCSAL